jgi:hypothetical protein
VGLHDNEQGGNVRRELRRKSDKFLSQVIVLAANTSFLCGNVDNGFTGPGMQ